MSSPVITVPQGTTRAQIAEVLTRRQISAAPVVDEAGNVVGLVSEHDLLAKSGGTAEDLMTTAVISVSMDCPLDDIRHLLVERRIRRVPVLQDGRLVGVVSRRDVVATMATEWACQVCGEPARGDEPPVVCPKCHAGAERFIFQEQPPGT
ncbi:MAG TPA: CBS domain-containing protein [Mycobacteriales bacterium]|nr:CBS domain-containing protein [Mycobacteriales bacterium]